MIKLIKAEDRPGLRNDTYILDIDFPLLEAGFGEYLDEQLPIVLKKLVDDFHLELDKEFNDFFTETEDEASV